MAEATTINVAATAASVVAVAARAAAEAAAAAVVAAEEAVVAAEAAAAAPAEGKINNPISGNEGNVWKSLDEAKTVMSRHCARHHEESERE